MEKFRTIIVEAGIILLGIITFGLFVVMMVEREDTEYTRRMLKREISQLELEVEHRDCMFGKYADSVPDAMLLDFYPETDNPDSLRIRLKERYEIKLRKDNDGLCY